MRGCHQLWSYRAVGRFGNLVVGALILGCGVGLAILAVPGPWAVCLFVISALFLLFDVQRDANWRRYYRRQEKYRHPIHARLTEDGVVTSLRDEETLVPWQHFQAFARSDGFLFLILNNRAFSVIPLDAFPTDSEAAAFEGMLVAKLRRLPRRFF